MKGTVITYGTFDLFHYGHLRLFERLRALGDRLLVGVSTDEFNAVKGKKTIVEYDHRVALVESVKYVDGCFPEESWEQKRDDVRRFGARVLAMGDDWSGKFDHLSDLCEVVYLPRTPNISTTDVKYTLNTKLVGELSRIEDAVRALSTIINALR